MTAMTHCLDRPGMVPRLSSLHVRRERLTQPLLASPARVRLLCAPAGSGKSALFAECLLQAPPTCTVHWLALNGLVSSPEEFSRAVAQALGLVVDSEAQLLACLARWQTPTWLFLDDYCRVPAPQLDALLDRLLTLSSPALTWWLGGRRRPHCNWPRLLLNDDLYESAGPELAFSRGEIQQLIAQLPHSLCANACERIFQRSGGWCASVRVALQDGNGRSASELKEGRSAIMLDYLQHELFNGLAPELAEAWRVLAHLPRFNLGLCEHLFGAGEGGHWMRTLQELGCFIEHWEDSPDWLQVFAPVAQLVRDEAWEAGRSWHRRACQWFVAEQDWQAAFEQALLADENEMAISLLQHFGFEHLFQQHNVVLLLRLYEQQGADLLLCSAQLVGLITAALLFAGRFEEAGLCIEHMARFAPQPCAAQQRELVARWQAQQGWLLHLQGWMAPARGHFLEALVDLPASAWPARLLCLSGLTQQALLRGELDVAQALNREALCLARAQGALLFEGLLELDHAQLLEQRGAPHRAESLLSGIHQLLCQHARFATPLLGRIALRRGRLALCQGQEARASEFFESGLEACLRSYDKRVLYGYLGLAHVAANQGDFAQAFLHLRDAERMMQRRQIPDTVYRGVLLHVSSHFWLQQGRPQLAHEALTRVLRHYHGPQARQAPPATLELIPRLEYLLVVTQVYLHQASRPLEQLNAQLLRARQCGMLGLETVLQLSVAQVAWLLGQPVEARAALQAAQALVERCNLRQALAELQRSLPSLFVAPPPQAATPQPTPACGRDNPLSQREIEVLSLIAQGNSNLQIAEQLFISLHTVKTHARRINGKLAVERRTQAVAKAKALGFFA